MRKTKNRQEFIDTLNMLLSECENNEDEKETMSDLGIFIYIHREQIEQILPLVDFRSQREINDEYFALRGKRK